MDEAMVRARAEKLCEALAAGDVGQAIDEFSDELRRNLGEVIALLPLPATEVAVESVEQSGPGFNVVLRLVGETDEVEVQTRWKDRDGEPKVVEVSHLSRAVREDAEPEPETEPKSEGLGEP
jgi:hypothetical protein